MSVFDTIDPAALPPGVKLPSAAMCTTLSACLQKHTSLCFFSDEDDFLSFLSLFVNQNVMTATYCMFGVMMLVMQCCPSLRPNVAWRMTPSQRKLWLRRLNLCVKFIIPVAGFLTSTLIAIQLVLALWGHVLRANSLLHIPFCASTEFWVLVSYVCASHFYMASSVTAAVRLNLNPLSRNAWLPPLHTLVTLLRLGYYYFLGTLLQHGLGSGTFAVPIAAQHVCTVVARLVGSFSRYGHTGGSERILTVAMLTAALIECSHAVCVWWWVVVAPISSGHNTSDLAALPQHWAQWYVVVALMTGHHMRWLLL